jgi:hypothetical protein
MEDFAFKVTLVAVVQARADDESVARARCYSVVDEFYDAAVSGADPIAERPGFRVMLERIAGNGVRVILVESPDRFPRDLAVQLAGHDFLRSLGVELIPTTAPNYFLEDTPTRSFGQTGFGRDYVTGRQAARSQRAQACRHGQVRWSKIARRDTARGRRAGAQSAKETTKGWPTVPPGDSRRAGAPGSRELTRQALLGQRDRFDAEEGEMSTVEIQVWDVSTWRTYERGIPNIPAFYVGAMRDAARSYPGRRVRAVDEDGRLVDLLAA